MSRLVMAVDEETGKSALIESPDFKCQACGRPVGARKRGPEHAWEPQACFWCRRKEQERDAARRRKLGHVVASVDLDKAFAAYRKLAPFKGNIGRHVKLTVGCKAEGKWSGHAKMRSRAIYIAFGPGVQPHEALEVLVHEMTHLACPKEDRRWHGERFRRTLKRAAAELWGIDVPLLSGSERGKASNAAYAMDRIIMEQLKAKIASGAVELFPPDPPKVEEPKPPKSRAEAMAKVVEKREAHVLKMHAKALTRLKRAKTIEAKWRKKVAYYERKAAKKGGG